MQGVQTLHHCAPLPLQLTPHVAKTKGKSRFWEGSREAWSTFLCRPELSLKDKQLSCQAWGRYFGGEWMVNLVEGEAATLLNPRERGNWAITGFALDLLQILHCKYCALHALLFPQLGTPCLPFFLSLILTHFLRHSSALSSRRPSQTLRLSPLPLF